MHTDLLLAMSKHFLDFELRRVFVSTGDCYCSFPVSEPTKSSSHTGAKKLKNSQSTDSSSLRKSTRQFSSLNRVLLERPPRE